MDKRKINKGISFLEILISLTILVLFIFGAFTLYVTGINQTKKAKLLLQATWLARGKLEIELKTKALSEKEEGQFSSPFESYRFQVVREDIEGKVDLKRIIVRVNGPQRTEVIIEALCLSPLNSKE